MFEQLDRLKTRVSIESGSPNEMRNRYGVVAGALALDLASVLVGHDVGTEEILYPVAGISSGVAVYQSLRATPLLAQATRDAVIRFFDRHG